MQNKHQKMRMQQTNFQVPNEVFSGVLDLGNFRKKHFWPFLAVFGT